MDGCKYSSELIILPMKKRMATWLQLFFFTNIPLLKESLKQWMTSTSPVK